MGRVELRLASVEHRSGGRPGEASEASGVSDANVRILAECPRFGRLCVRSRGRAWWYAACCNCCFMARKLRFVPAGAVVEITVRTIQSRFLLRPSEQVNDTILGVLGRAQAVCNGAVTLHAFAFLSNHYHLLVSPKNAEALARFVGHINSNLARELGALHDWREKLWGRRYQGIVVADEASQITRLRYILAHGCKEGLVASPLDWPGVHCAAALATGRPLTGTWFDRTAAYEAGRRGERGGDGSEFRVEYAVTLTPLPCRAGMSREAYREFCASLVDDIERETALANAKLGRHPMGRKSILHQHPHDRPTCSKRGAAPLVHAVTRAARARFRAAYHLFVERYRKAAESLRRGFRDVTFPEGAFPAPAPFVGCAPAAPGRANGFVECAAPSG